MGSAGTTGGKKIHGRKRHYLVDTPGHLLTVVVHGADVNDREGAEWVLARGVSRWPTLRKGWADQGYTGELVNWAQRECGLALEIVTKRPEQVGFTQGPKVMVERLCTCIPEF